MNEKEWICFLNVFLHWVIKINGIKTESIPIDQAINTMSIGITTMVARVVSVTMTAA